MANSRVMMLLVSLTFVCAGAVRAEDEEPPAAEPSLVINFPGLGEPAEKTPHATFTAQFSAEALEPILTDRVELLPIPMQFETNRTDALNALRRVSMEAVVQELMPLLTSTYADSFDPDHDLIVTPVSKDKRVTIETADLPEGAYTGPTTEVVGFLLHRIDEQQYLQVAIRVFQVARQLLSTGSPAVDRLSPSYYEIAATREVAAMVDTIKDKETVRRQIGDELGVYDENGNIDESRAEWVKESRRFSYVVKDGQFIEKLRPMVEQINADMKAAGFTADEFPVDTPGIHFDADLRDVEILLPRNAMERFLKQADLLERRMAEESMISVEVVRLTDRDIEDGVVASRAEGSFQGVHDRNVGVRHSLYVRQLGVNALTAVANRELSVLNASQIASGTVPAGTEPIVMPGLDITGLTRPDEVTTLGTDFTTGADPVFFDSRRQTLGFSYIGPDGIRHVLNFETMDSLRRFWERIERNLIVHKIKKTPDVQNFTVPVGPETKTFQGIAALISQQNQEIVVSTGTGAQSKLSATAGSWLVVKDFDIIPTPGSSTALSDEEMQEIRDRVLMTMLLRDPLVDVNVKTELVETESREVLSTELTRLLNEYGSRPVRPGRDARSFGYLYGSRFEDMNEVATVEKKERNSKIAMTFYSSQGIILAEPGATSLGDSNELTSFTTQLRPNKVTPISSFVSKTASDTADSSSLTGVARGERSREEKAMVHLLIRARFPHDEREIRDRDEGAYLGYFKLPMGKKPLSQVDLPFLSSSEHPLDRLAQMTPGRMFETLDPARVMKVSSWLNPNRLQGGVPIQVFEANRTRVLFNRRLIAASPHQNQSLLSQYRRRFIVQVRSLLEYDEDLFDAPNIALRNMAQWNDPYRIVVALQNSAGKFAYHRLIKLIDDVGASLIDMDMVDDRLAVTESGTWGRHRLRPLTADEVIALQRDVGAHYLRMEELYGDAFLEAVAMILGLGSYNTLDYGKVKHGPFHGYERLVMFDRDASTYVSADLIIDAHENFLLLRRGGLKGEMFKSGYEYVENMPKELRRFVIVGKDILKNRETPKYKED